MAPAADGVAIREDRLLEPDEHAEGSERDHEVLMGSLYRWGVPTLFRAPYDPDPARCDIARLGVPHSTDSGTTERDQHLGLGPFATSRRWAGGSACSSRWIPGSWIPGRAVASMTAVMSPCRGGQPQRTLHPSRRAGYRRGRARSEAARTASHSSARPRGPPPCSARARPGYRQGPVPPGPRSSPPGASSPAACAAAASARSRVARGSRMRSASSRYTAS